MILVTGAAGKTGQAVLRALLKRQVSVRASVHRASQIPVVEALGVSEAIAGDLRSSRILQQAAPGVQAIYHICPNVSPDEVTIARNTIQAAQAAQVGHFVYHSVLHPQIEAMPHHWLKMRVEELLFESGLAYTILQPAPYMQNLWAYWTDLVEHGRYPVPYAADAPLSFVDLEDVAEVAAMVLTEAGHHAATYELCGSETLSPRDIAQIVSQLLGHPIAVEVIPRDSWERSARERGLGDYQIKALTRMFQYYEQFGLIGNSRVLQCLLKRPPTDFAAFINRMLRESA